MRDHPLRKQISEEVHARPFQKLKSNIAALHLAVGFADCSRDHVLQQLVQLLEQFALPAEAVDKSFFYCSNENIALRYEAHNEFYTVTLYQLSDVNTQSLLNSWYSLPGELIAGVELLFVDKSEDSNALLQQRFSKYQITGSEVMGGAARIWTDFRPDEENGFTRIVVQEQSLKSFQAGRLIQRLCEIETYRHVALLALPVAKQVMPKVTMMDKQLAEVTHEMTKGEGCASRLLQKLTELSSEVEELSAETANRFSASHAYFSVLDTRITELRESRIEGLQTVAQFMERRLDPAKRTCISANDRIERLSRRIARASNLIRSQVELSIERQNHELLEGLNSRARLQLRLQAKLESFTIIVVTYYAFDLIERTVRNTVRQNSIQDDLLMVLSFSVPLIAGVLWWYVRKLLKHYSDEQ